MSWTATPVKSTTVISSSVALWSFLLDIIVPSSTRLMETPYYDDGDRNVIMVYLLSFLDPVDEGFLGQNTLLYLYRLVSFLHIL